MPKVKKTDKKIKEEKVSKEKQKRKSLQKKAKRKKSKEKQRLSPLAILNLLDGEKPRLPELEYGQEEIKRF